MPTGDLPGAGSGADGGAGDEIRAHGGARRLHGRTETGGGVEEDVVATVDLYDGR